MTVSGRRTIIHSATSVSARLFEVATFPRFMLTKSHFQKARGSETIHGGNWTNGKMICYYVLCSCVCECAFLQDALTAVPISRFVQFWAFKICCTTMIYVSCREMRQR